MRRARLTFRVLLLGAHVGVPIASAAQATGATGAIPVAPAVVDLDRPPAIEFDPGEIDLHRVTAVIPRADGSVVVANSGSLQLLVFARDGRFVRAAGGKGSGPGEYQELWSLDRMPGDSIVVLDRMLRRASILTPDGKFVRSFAVAAPFDGGGAPIRLVALRNGDLLLGYSEVRTMEPTAQAQVFKERLVVHHSTGVATPGPGSSLLGSEHFTQAVPLEHGGVAYWDLSFGRTLTVRAIDGGFVAGDGTDWSVNVHQIPGGAVVARPIVVRAVARVTPAAIAAARRAGLATVRPERAGLIERMYDEMPFPTTMPAYARFEVDERDRVWIEEYSPSHARPNRALWLRVDHASRTAVAVRFPARFQPMAFARGRVFGIWRDEDDVQHVRAYDLDIVR